MGVGEASGEPIVFLFQSLELNGIQVGWRRGRVLHSASRKEQVLDS